MADAKPRMTIESAASNTQDAKRGARSSTPALDVQTDPVTDADAPEVETPQEEAHTGSDGTDSARSDAKSSPMAAASAWVGRSFPGHENAFLGGVAGLVVAVLVFVVGIGRTLLIALLVLVGVAIGQALDGDPKIINAIRALVEARDN